MSAGESDVLPGRFGELRAALPNGMRPADCGGVRFKVGSDGSAGRTSAAYAEGRLGQERDWAVTGVGRP